MSVADKYEEGKLALQRASMTLDEWYFEILGEITPEWLVSQVSDPSALLVDAAKYYNDTRAKMGSVLKEHFASIIKEEAERRMQKARDDYEEQYGRRS